ncbi:MAG: hypothetical protein Q9O74_01980 [Planctomycetota bacterium]|nr:hypothetical protein [Planctomycetota bacterium]
MAFQEFCRARSEPEFLLERLEDRIVLSAPTDIAIVGLSYDATNGYVPYVQELLWAEDRSITGEVLTPDDSGPANPTTISDLINAPAGAVRWLESAGDFAPESILASRFDTGAGYPLGWFGAAEGDGAAGTANVGAVIERSPDATTTDLVGTWTIQFTQVLGSQVFTRNGTVSITTSGGFFALAFGSAGDPVFAGQGFEFVGEPDNGRFEIRMANGDTGSLYLNADKSVIAFVDLDTADTDTWMGVGIRPGTDLSTQDLAGSYRAGVLFESDRLSDEAEGDLTTAWRIDLAEDGTFEIFDLAEVDNGAVEGPQLSGTWTGNAGAVTLTDTSGVGTEITLTISDNGLSGIVAGIRVGTLVSPERPMGLLTKIVVPSGTTIETSLFASVLDADGFATVFDLRQPDDTWSVVDLSRYAAPDPDFPNSTIDTVPTAIDTFETSDGRLVAVVNTDATLLAFERDTQGFWQAKDLTRSLTSAEPITSSLTIFTDRDGIAYVAGVTGVGDVVTYKFDPTPADRENAWSYANISQDHLTPRGQETPVFVGPLMSFVTPWNALNIAGLDAEGNIQAVWTGNGGVEWNASNLSAITGAPPMTSGLTAFVTTWSAINIVGLDADGNVLATWWVPAFEGNWAVSNLTTIAAGEPLTGSTLTSFIAPWGALNIAGLTASGDVATYWWTPGFEDDGKTWQVANLTASFDPSDPKPDSQLQSQTNSLFGGELNILGTDSDTGELVRLFFRVQDAVWVSENVTTIADYV